MFDNIELMRNEEIGKSETFLKVLKKIEGLSLDRNVQRRHGFITYHKLRVESQGSGDTDAFVE